VARRLLFKPIRFVYAAFQPTSRGIAERHPELT
jgi:hypothetical protein